MTIRPIYIDADALPANGTALQLKTGATGEIEASSGGGGGAALMRGAATLYGYTGDNSTAPPQLVFQCNYLSTPQPNFIFYITLNGATTTFSVATSDPSDGSIWLDSNAISDAATLLSAMQGIIVAYIPTLGAFVDGWDLRMDSSGTGGTATLSGSVVGTMDIFVSGGGTGSGGPYGHVDEVTLIAADGVKVVSPVRLFFASDTGLTSEVTFAIKSSVGGYYPLSVVSASVSVGEARPASYSQLMQWDLNLTGNSLVAKITGAIPAGGDLTCFAIAEQG